MKPYCLILLLCFSVAAQAAVTHDATSSATCAEDPSSSISWQHTVTAGGSHRIVIAAVHYFTHSTAETVTSATYAGAAMTLLSRVNDTDSFGVELWYKVDPATGSNPVQANMSAATNICAGAWSFTNVHQSVPFGTPSTNNGFNTPSTLVITSAANEIVIDAATFGIDATPGGSQTQSWDTVLNISDPDGHAEASRQTGAASTSMTWTFTDGNYVRHIAVAVKEATASSIVPIIQSRRRR